MQDLGRMDISCRKCHAKHWQAEETKSKDPDKKYTLCCAGGDAMPDLMPEPPFRLRSLYTEQSDEAQHFRDHIRAYNSAMAFTSCKYTEDDRVSAGYKSFTIKGELIHSTGRFHPRGQVPSFAQFYFLDPVIAAQHRCRVFDRTREGLLRELAEMLEHVNNPYIRLYKTAKKRLDEHDAEMAASEDAPDAIRVGFNPDLTIVEEKGADPRRNNFPTANEVAAFLPDDTGYGAKRSIILDVRRADGTNAPNLRTIDYTQSSYMPLHYVLLFPSGH